MKKIKAGFLVSIMLFAFAGAALAADPVTITIWDFKYGDTTSGVQEAMQKIDETIMEANPNITIEHVGQSHDNYYQIIRAAVLAGEGPDVVMFHAGARAYEFDEFTLPLNDYIKPWRDEIDEFSWAFTSEGGDASKPVHLVPITIQGMGIYYNKTLFTQAGLDPENPPTDVDAFMEACEKLKAAGIVPITAGGQGGAYSIAFLFKMMVANIYGPDTRDLLSGEQNLQGNPAFRRASEIVLELVENEYFDPNQSSIPYFMDAANMFAAGKGAMFVGLLSDVCHWKSFNDGLGKDAVGYFPTINFPEAPYKDLQVAAPAGIGYSVMNWTKNPDEAAKVVEGYARGEGAAIWMGMTGALAPNKKVDVESLGYPLVGEILSRTPVMDFGTLLSVEGVQNFEVRYTTQAYISQEITVDEFIDLMQDTIDNSKP